MNALNVAEKFIMDIEIDMTIQDMPEKTPYEEGRLACMSDNPEPPCEYFPGTEEYKQYAEGFCHRVMYGW
jgi:hypothetical protein